jgi:hypothetical protein
MQLDGFVFVVCVVVGVVYNISTYMYTHAVTTIL